MTASADDMCSRDKNSEPRRGFLNQKILDDLTVTLDGEEIKLFSHPHFLATLYRQSVASMQSEPLDFLQEIYQVNQRHLSMLELETETSRLVAKYIDPDSDNCLNVGASTNLESYHQMMKEGKMLASFEPIVNEMCTLLKTNMGRSVTLFSENRTISKEEILQQLRDAYQLDKQDKLFYPVRSVICSAMESINNALEKLTAQTVQLSEKEKELSSLVIRRRADTLVDESVVRIRKMYQDFRDLLVETTVLDAKLSQVEDNISKILDECDVLRKASSQINQALGKPNSRSRKIDNFLIPLLAVKEWHQILTINLESMDSNERAEKESLKNSSLFACHTLSNTQTVEKYMRQVQAIEKKSLQRAETTASFVGRRI